MISLKELKRWIDTLDCDCVAVDEGGLNLVEVDMDEHKPQVGDAYLEVGGVPLEDPDDED
jgi:hypothetical protein